MEYIKIGNYQIRKESLEGLTLKEAKEKYPALHERTLKYAWEQCNPKRKRGAKKKKG